uniref:Uncharacterized protein n=1 Tax=Rhizophora mucronata TaxID=61149 RepID=A0A2P2PRV2_RHIMU
MEWRTKKMSNLNSVSCGRFKCLSLPLVTIT